MSTVLFPIPTDPEKNAFIRESNAMEQCDISQSDIDQTLAKKIIHPLVAGHIMAIEYAIHKLASESSWPVRHAAQCQSEHDSLVALHWVRQLHHLLFSPITKYGLFLAEELPLTPSDIGQYRVASRNLIDGRSITVRWLPKPAAIPRLMHYFHRDLATFHLAMLPKLARPESLTNDDLGAMARQARRSHLMLQAIHPFLDGTGRSARLVENALRLRWGLPWKTHRREERLSYVREIIAFEDSPQWQQVLTTLDAREPAALRQRELLAQSPPPEGGIH